MHILHKTSEGTDCTAADQSRSAMVSEDHGEDHSEGGRQLSDQSRSAMVSESHGEDHSEAGTVHATRGRLNQLVSFEPKWLKQNR